MISTSTCSNSSISHIDEVSIESESSKDTTTLTNQPLLNSRKHNYNSNAHSIQHFINNDWKKFCFFNIRSLLSLNKLRDLLLCHYSFHIVSRCWLKWLPVILSKKILLLTQSWFPSCDNTLGYPLRNKDQINNVCLFFSTKSFKKNDWLNFTLLRVSKLISGSVFSLSKRTHTYMEYYYHL